MPLAMIASGLAASTASVLMRGASCLRPPNTFTPPHRRIASEITCSSLIVISGEFQIW